MNSNIKFCILFFCTFFSLFAFGIDQDQEVKLCNSSQEFIQALKFLRSNGTAGMKEEVARSLSDEIAKGCDGAANRFKKTYVLLKSLGVSHIKSLELALDFSRQSDDVQKNFFEILKQSYLVEFLNYDFELAIKIAYDLSVNLKANHAQARDDFILFVKFCLDKNQMSGPLNVCGNLAIELVKLSPHYKEGVFEPFKKLYLQLREGEGFGLSMKDTLEVTLRVLKYGPKAPNNFSTAFQYALDKDGMGVPPKEALAFGLKMAKRSTTGFPLPLIEIENDKEPGRFD